MIRANHDLRHDRHRHFDESSGAHGDFHSHAPGGIESFVILVVALTALLLLAEAGRHGTVGMFLNPRIVPRTITALAALSGMAAAYIAYRLRRRWRVLRRRRAAAGDRDSGEGVGYRAVGWWRSIRAASPRVSAIRAVLPLVIPVVLLPAAARHGSADFSDIRLFVPSASLTTPSAPELSTRFTESSGAAAGENQELLDAVAEVYGDAQSTRGGTLPTALRSTRSAELPTAGPIVIDDASFDATIQALWDAPHRYVGRTVQLTAFVYRRPEWGSNRFVAARMLLWCCVADAMVIGLLVDPDETGDPPRERRWIEISGELSVTDSFNAGSVQMSAVPTLRNVTWTPVAPPAQEYVFSSVW